MTTTSGGTTRLHDQMSGSVVGPDDPTYDDVRKVWNADIDCRPAALAHCRTEADVQAAVTYAVQEDLEIAVRAGAHSMSGKSVVDDGLVIDLTQLNQVTVDAAARRARVGGGALLSDLDAATQEHGLAAPAGLVSHTGVAGLTLGGGMGWLTRCGGLSIDNLVSVRVVTADGQVHRAADDENPDLFWAIRGGGGNFGVVTEFEFRLHEVGPMVSFAMLFWELDEGPELLRLARNTMATLPMDMNMIIGGLNAPPAPFVPEHLHGAPGYALIVVGFGDADSHAAAIAGLRDQLAPAFEFVTPMPYVALQQLLDEANAWGFHCYDKGCYVDDLSDDLIDALVEEMPKKNSPMSLILFYRLDGAFCDVAEDATAFSGGRSPRFAVFIIAVCPAPELLDADRAWVRQTYDAIRPFAIGAEAYVNGVTDFDDDIVHAMYGSKYERLSAIKAAYDPGNVFHRNANIRPAASA